MDQLGRGAWVELKAVPFSPICPVAAVGDFYQIRPHGPGVFFKHEDGTALSHFQFQAVWIKNVWWRRGCGRIIILPILSPLGQLHRQSAGVWMIRWCKALGAGSLLDSDRISTLIYCKSAGGVSLWLLSLLTLHISMLFVTGSP